MARVSVVGRTRWLMVAVAALSVAVVFVVFYFAWTAYTVRLSTEDLSRQAQVIASGLAASDLTDTSDDPSDALRMRLFRVEAGLIGATLARTDSEGTVIVSSRDDGADEGRTYPLDRLDEPDDDGVRSAVVDVDGVGRVLLVAAPVGDPADDGYLVALQAVREINSARDGVVMLLALSAAFAVVVAWIAGGWSARRLTGPVVRLERASEAIASGEWGHQALVEGDDEVARLAIAFNNMSARVAAAYRAQQEFVGNVSHELRTPITAIAGFAQALRDGVTRDEDRDRHVGIIHKEAERLSELTSVLLALADLEAGAVVPASGSVEGRAIGAVLTERHGQSAGARDLTLDVSGLSGTFVSDEHLVVQALSTLVENAIRYASPGGRVEVGLEREDGLVVLSVDDDGPGIPEAHRALVFERFARIDDSRSKEDGGSGLGLAICRRIVDVLGGTVEVDSSKLGGARFALTLPQPFSNST